jgi:hypothetical protein
MASARISSINRIFEKLRILIPTFPYERRLSKIDTLHLTISYIHFLETILKNDMSMLEYLESILNNKRRPSWATQDLLVRLNWLDWSSLGFEQQEIQIYMRLFKEISDLMI